MTIDASTFENVPRLAGQDCLNLRNQCQKIIDTFCLQTSEQTFYSTISASLYRLGLSLKVHLKLNDLLTR